MKQSFLILVLVSELTTGKKNAGAQGFGTVSYTYAGKTINGRNYSPIYVYYLNGSWLDCQCFMGTEGDPANRVAVTITPIRANDSIVVNYTYLLGFAGASIKTQLLQDRIYADSLAITFTSISNNMASGKFYVRGHRKFLNDIRVTDSITNGQFANVPMDYLNN